MNYLLLFGLIASVYAAPHYHQQRFGPPPFFPELDHHGLAHQHRGYPNNDGYFDTNKFWTDFSKEMRELDDMLAEMTRNFATTSLSQEGVEGNEYRITIPLSGFEEKDIIVKAREGLLMTQAQHKYSEGSERNYLDIRHLPDTVNVTGIWTYEKGVLRIVFPLKEGVETTNVESVSVLSTDFTTKRPTFDREEVEDSNTDEVAHNQDADVGLNRGDEDNEVLTNEISGNSAVEATTYAVDLKNEVEFVPVRY